jgi:hypothetical protein
MVTAQKTWSVSSTAVKTSFYSMAQQSLVSQGLPIIKGSRSHSDISHSTGLLGNSDPPVAETYKTQHSQHIYILAPGGIRTRNRRKRAAAGSRLRPRGQWNRLWELHNSLKSLKQILSWCTRNHSGLIIPLCHLRVISPSAFSPKFWTNFCLLLCVTSHLSNPPRFNCPNSMQR